MIEPRDAMDSIPTVIKGSFDLASIGVMVGTVFNHLPGVAALFTIVWTGIRILETRTISRLLGKKSDTE